MSLLALSLFTAVARAGDPCPIDFRVSNLGPLDKEGAVAIADDAVFARLVTWLGQAECTSVTVAKADQGVLPLGDPGSAGLRTWRLQALLMDDKGGFRCDDAHVALAALSAVPDSGHVIYQRGTRRVLLTAAGWGTACMDLSALESGGDAALEKLWTGATGKLVKDRHDNP